MKLQINICYFVALVLIFDIANGKYLLIEVDGEEKTNLKNDCKGTSCDITKNIVEEKANLKNDCKGTSCDITRNIVEEKGNLKND